MNQIPQLKMDGYWKMLCSVPVLFPRKRFLAPDREVSGQTLVLASPGTDAARETNPLVRAWARHNEQYPNCMTNIPRYVEVTRFTLSHAELLIAPGDAYFLVRWSSSPVKMSLETQWTVRMNSSSAKSGSKKGLEILKKSLWLCTRPSTHLKFVLSWKRDFQCAGEALSLSYPQTEDFFAAFLFNALDWKDGTRHRAGGIF